MKICPLHGLPVTAPLQYPGSCCLRWPLPGVRMLASAHQYWYIARV
jgi:hypothetical protein